MARIAQANRVAQARYRCRRPRPGRPRRRGPSNRGYSAARASRIYRTRLLANGGPERWVSVNGAVSHSVQAVPLSGLSPFRLLPARLSSGCPPSGPERWVSVNGAVSHSVQAVPLSGFLVRSRIPPPTSIREFATTLGKPGDAFVAGRAVPHSPTPYRLSNSTPRGLPFCSATRA